MKYPYTVVAGEGLGISYSSLAQVGPLQESKKFGQAEVGVYLNAANGNVFIQDRLINMVELNGDIELGYVYNSQAVTVDTAWRLNMEKRFKKLPSATNPGGTATLVESDGHETTYTFVAAQGNLYQAPGLANGTPYLAI